MKTSRDTTTTTTPAGWCTLGERLAYGGAELCLRAGAALTGKRGLASAALLMRAAGRGPAPSVGAPEGPA